MKSKLPLIRSLVVVLVGPLCVCAQSFSIQGPNVNPADFEITTFADGLNYPVGMVELSDASILVGVTDGSFSGSSGDLIRLADTNNDGVSDEQTVLYDNMPIGGITDVRVANDLVFVTGQKKNVQVLRLGDETTDPLTRLGEIQIQYPSGGWWHPHSALLARSTSTEAVELFFQVGSDENVSVTERQVRFSGFGIQNERMNGDSIYRVTFTDTGNGLTATDLTQIATGLRNAAGLEFDSEGNLYLQDNGIDGAEGGNEPESADELNLISAADIGGSIEDFGYPFNYTQYRTDELIGDDNSTIQPLVAFQPIGDPLTGAEGEGPNDIAFAPQGFPSYLNDGMFVTMHGKFSVGGVENEENPLVYVDLKDNSYFHFISNEEPDIGHIDGLLTTDDSMYLADISNGGFSGGSNDSGAIYKIRAVSQQLLLADANGDGEITSEDAIAFCNVSQREEALAEFGSVLGDLDFDGNVAFADFLVLSENFGAQLDSPNYSLGDIDCSGSIAFADFLILSANFGHSNNLAAVPEPNSTTLFAFGAITICLIRRTRG